MTRLQSGERHRIRFKLNGAAAHGEAEPRMLLTDFLRQQIGATGTHVGCEHGVCGACTVIVDGMIARACLTLAVQVDGSDVRTVEGLAPAPDRLGILQEAFKRHHALQCGFCTASVRQARAIIPSTVTVQAPQTPCSHPTCVPVAPIW